MALKDWKKTNEERGNSFNESKSENYWDEWTNTKTGDKIFVGNITDKGIEKWYFEIGKKYAKKNQYGLFLEKSLALNYAKKYMRMH